MNDDDCREHGCAWPEMGAVYGLYDPRIDDMFYVGSTVQQPGHRYSDHVHASRPSNYREAWIMAILADGALPLFCSLYEWKKVCRGHLLEAEHAIAFELRALGHTAICDAIPGAFPESWRRRAVFPLTGWRSSGSIETQRAIYRAHIAEYLDLVNEQARIMQWLRAI